ncbi:cyclopropane-fatty-acyl-phospholipid synthase [Pelagibacteraceae bacterium]|nr:cyclopropane-fatty-acyl-phospholipid synthase family protein [Pelagibacteraceae bacterium]MDC0952631.1 cyclopropane-fatty-acyl-phospholipid synthase [Pelagibacteraceae bacterium]
MSFTKFSEKIILNKLKNIRDGNLKLVNYDGKVFHFGNLESKLSADIKIINPAFYFNIILGGSSALGEAHMNKDFYTSNLTDLIEISAKNINLIYSFSGSLKIQKIKNFLKKIFASNTKSKSLKYISKHYDLGNDFFSQWLDETLTYSSAVYENQNDNLETAQKNKYQKLIDLLNIKDNNKVLEIGCGWGGFSEYLAKQYNVSIDCITISKKQLEFTKKRIFQAGLNNKVNVMFLDYRDLKEKYDKVVSVEMIEAVGEKYLDKYFNTIKKSLNTNGTAAIQGITIRDDLFDRYRSSEDFIQKYIFPGGFLPSIDFMKHLINKNKLNLLKINSYPDDYAKTLNVWKKNFFKTWDNISPLGFDETFKRMWEFYLSYCEAGFKARNINLIQCSMSNK